MNLEISLEELLKNGSHFGHNKKRWNPKMEKFIYGEKNGTHNADFGVNGIIGVNEKIISLVPPIISKNNIFIIYKSFITSHELPSGKLIWKKK